MNDEWGVRLRTWAEGAFMQRIFLTGLSGAGKSTVGRRVPTLLNWDFVDTDDLLAAHAGMPVGQALTEYAEERFRQLESEALREAPSREPEAIATGGGVGHSAANRRNDSEK